MSRALILFAAVCGLVLCAGVATAADNDESKSDLVFYHTSLLLNGHWLVQESTPSCEGLQCFTRLYRVRVRLQSSWTTLICVLTRSLFDNCGAFYLVVPPFT